MGNITSVQIKGKIGYHDIHKPDKFSADTSKPKYVVQLAISDEEFAKYKNAGLDVVRDRAGNPKTLSSLNIDGNVIRGERLVSKGKIEVVGADGSAINELIGYGSDVTIDGFLSTFTNNFGTFTKLYINKLIVTNLIKVEPKVDSSQGAII